MAISFHAWIAQRLEIPAGQVERTIHLLEEGATIPFISRYRKEMTGGLNEVQISAIQELHTKLRELEKRKESILSSIEEQGKLTPELKKAHRRFVGTVPRWKTSICLTNPSG